MKNKKIELDELLRDFEKLKDRIEPNALLEDIIAEKDWVIEKHRSEIAKLQKIIFNLEMRNSRLSYVIFHRLKRNFLAQWLKKKLFPQGIDQSFLSRFKER